MYLIRNAVLALAIVAGATSAAVGQEWRGYGVNQVQVDQRGGPHRTAALQRGVGDLVAIAQQGRGHIGVVTQVGDNNVATIRQFGHNNTASVAQSGDNNAACVMQVGNNVGADVVQMGGQSVGIIQTRRGTREVPVEVCTAASLGRGGVLLGVGRR